MKDFPLVPCSPVHRTENSLTPNFFNAFALRAGGDEPHIFTGPHFDRSRSRAGGDEPGNVSFAQTRHKFICESVSCVLSFQGEVKKMKRMNLTLDDVTAKNLRLLAVLKETTIARLIKYFVDREIKDNPDECELCRKYGHEPNEETIKALKEKGGKTFSSVKDFFADLEKDGLKATPPAK